jgi:hypothetical protein
MAHVTTGTLKHPTREDMEREFSRPWSMPNTNIIYGSLEFCQKFEEAINGTGTTQNTHNSGKVR